MKEDWFESSKFKSKPNRIISVTADLNVVAEKRKEMQICKGLCVMNLVYGIQRTERSRAFLHKDESIAVLKQLM
ncbi:MAG: hypothetical protein BGO52_08540 [Sphingobacteriales bacterium 44-61]|nr:MAG: hypothetical protein BGO52_08540 [Sphingobacteriales bacterium 44-61]